MDGLTRNWILLLGLCLATTLLAGHGAAPVGAAALLILAFFKLRTILTGFLHLTPESGWLGAFLFPLGLWLTALGLLHLLY